MYTVLTKGLVEELLRVVKGREGLRIVAVNDEEIKVVDRQGKEVYQMEVVEVAEDCEIKLTKELVDKLVKVVNEIEEGEIEILKIGDRIEVNLEY